VARLLPQLLIPGRPVRGGGRASGDELRGGACVAVELEKLRGMSLALRRRVLRAAAESLGASLNFAATEQVLNLCGFENKGVSANPRSAAGKGALHLENGLRAERSLRELRLFLAEAAE
jgi:tRNA(Ile)-lysidine synthase